MSTLKMIAATVLVGSTSLACATTVELSWRPPSDHSGIHATGENQQRWQAQVLSGLERQFQREALVRIADGQELNVALDELDLSGEIEYGLPAIPLDLRVTRPVIACTHGAPAAVSNAL